MSNNGRPGRPNQPLETWLFAILMHEQSSTKHKMMHQKLSSRHQEPQILVTSECFPVCFHSDVNMVISAPTGSGKTVLFELCILRLLSRFINAEGRFVHVKGSLKTIYIAPSKALVQEKFRDWNQKFGTWGINCLELTGDNGTYNSRNMHDVDIILTTPEKFDAVSRYGVEGGGLSFFSGIALLLIDEVHLLNDPRGASLEAIVSRIKIVASNPKMKLNPIAQVRFLAVSATIPNIEDLGNFYSNQCYPESWKLK
ncbi:unnamed protein product [Lupinus luteus]|uniref:Helicase ATP-binding domain-containing protein n=1 Tax=Lupinus luteus TaxID=3873 RepID=A0AAV1XAB1_LUPLU